ncbi:JAB domain-containing protein [Erythrobacter alti]|uniref:JAB domain-containing protein n=1 Tax=Erythrobacter alti TaxID=1896145 RepID=UPI0030F4AA23
MAAYLTPLIGDQAGVVARQLLAHFGTIARSVDASPEALVAALPQHNAAAAAICAARELMRFAANEQLVGQKVRSDDKLLHGYLRARLHNPVEERMHAIFLNQDHIFLAGEDVAVGTLGAMLMRIRHLVHRALDLGANGLLIAHNHPSGSCRPSDSDCKSTEDLISIAHALEIQVIDHLIISTDGIFSMQKGQQI